MNGIPSPAQGVWYLGPIPLRAYAIAIIVGIILGGWLAARRYKERGSPDGVLVDTLMWAVPAGIIGARIYHVISSPAAYFGPNGNPIKALYIWEGGLGIWGAIPAGALAAWLFLRAKGLRLSTFADSLAPGILIAQAVGRIGNYFNQELFGAPTDLPWGLQISEDVLAGQGLDFPAGTLFHPTFLYELLWNLTAAAVLIYLDRRLRLGHGRAFWLYVALYTTGRLWIEMLRIDTAELIFGVRVNVWVSLATLIFALVMFAVLKKKGPREDSAWLPGREPDEEPEDETQEDTVR